MPERSPANVALGLVVRRWRHAHRVSQEELGFRCGLHRTFVGAVERGERNVTLATVVKLGEGTGMGLSGIAERVEQVLEEEGR